ncbi:MAG: hypothetical protein LBO81_07060 [Clostridiales Family XIII bacterium]|jgi:hypothetical protein|nr:hypothetical protein [Clostridiales Family XIII bacterium]
MKLTDEQVKKLLEYEGPIQLHQLALNLALTRFKTVHKRNPGAETVAKCTVDLNSLLEKYEKIMKEDYDWIVSL